MPTPTTKANLSSATIEEGASVIRKPKPFAPTANVTRKTTHKKLTKQLQNSLWLRICSGRIAFMLCWQLQNSTKFHFGNTKTTNKSIRSSTTQKRQQQHQNPKIIGKYRKQPSHRRRSGAIQTTTTSVLKAKDTDTHTDIDIDTATDTGTETDRAKGIDIGAATEDAQLLAKWIHSSSSASSGTVIRLTWQ